MEDSRLLACELIEKAGSQPECSDLIRLNFFKKFRWRQGDFRIDDGNCPTIKECAPYFKSAGVEGGIGKMTDDVRVRNFAVVRVSHQSNDGTVGNDDALGHARRSGREHHISCVVHPACKISPGQGLFSALLDGQVNLFESQFMREPSNPPSAID